VVETDSDLLTFFGILDLHLYFQAEKTYFNTYKK